SGVDSGSRARLHTQRSAASCGLRNPRSLGNDVPLFGESATVTTQVILYEKKDVIEIHTAHQDLAVDHVYTQGIENADGTVAAFIPGRVAANYSLTNDAVRFTTKSPGPSAPGREANRPILWSENGHYYLLVEQTLTWQQ